MKVDDVMTDDVFVVGPEDSIADAVKKLAEHGISGSPVVDGQGALVGIITEADILNALKVKYKRLKMVYPSLSLVSVSFVEKFDNKEAVEAFKEIASSKVSWKWHDNSMFSNHIHNTSSSVHSPIHKPLRVHRGVGRQWIELPLGSERLITPVPGNHNSLLG